VVANREGPRPVPHHMMRVAVGVILVMNKTLLLVGAAVTLAFLSRNWIQSAPLQTGGPPAARLATPANAYAGAGWCILFSYLGTPKWKPWFMRDIG
jgi:hypothetical protein